MKQDIQKLKQYFHKTLSKQQRHIKQNWQKKEQHIYIKGMENTNKVNIVYVRKWCFRHNGSFSFSILFILLFLFYLRESKTKITFILITVNFLFYVIKFWRTGKQYIFYHFLLHILLFLSLLDTFIFLYL